MRFSLAPVAAIAIAATAGLAGCSLLGLDSVEDIQLAVGECLDDSSITAEEAAEGVMPVVDCAEPHESEVYFVEDQTDDEFPDDLQARAEDLCYDNYEAFTGAPFEESEYGISYYTPNWDTWDAGDRQIACLVESYDQVTGTLKGAEA